MVQWLGLPGSTTGGVLGKLDPTSHEGAAKKKKVLTMRRFRSGHGLAPFMIFPHCHL